MNGNSSLKVSCFALVWIAVLMSTVLQIQDVKTRYPSDYVVATLVLALVSTTIVIVFRRKSWPIWSSACLLVGLVGSFVFFQRTYFPPQPTFPLPPLWDIHDGWVPAAYFLFTVVTLAVASFIELAMDNSSNYRYGNRMILVAALLVLLSTGYAWSPFDSSLKRIVKSSVSKDVKLGQLRPYLKVGDDFQAFRSRVSDIAEEDIRLDAQVLSYTFRKCGLQVVTFADWKVYAIAAQNADGWEWLVRPGDLMWPGDPATATCEPYTIDHRIKDLLDDCYSSSYASRKAYVSSFRQNASSGPELKRLLDELDEWECNRLLGRLSLYVNRGQDIGYFLRRMKETPIQATSSDGTLRLWRFPTSGLLLVTKITRYTMAQGPTEDQTNSNTLNIVVDIGCQRDSKTHWFVYPANPVWQD